MEHKNDFIEREIQKISFFLRKMFSSISSTDEVFSLQAFNEDLKEKLDFGFYELLALNEEELKNKIHGVDILILEDLLKVFYEIDKEEIVTLESYNLSRVSLILINEIENKSKVFSFERQQIKNYFNSEKKEIESLFLRKQQHKK
ncbi:hypothetical protein SAMN05216503_2170 [Polaribacter sp. KT25b]|uniref:hypothetical protein n=1 Tax=Polaribacter sp. KT25b TaxID=1855336 RepID=UPI0008792870|nr:hypothetical protein [Polaribacter sp. KT25b]SDS15991.1 hypothetical protein SAMN05216503_2170 [Polaribacter sp. KT25b]